jgi:hypothetical protein
MSRRIGGRSSVAALFLLAGCGGGGEGGGSGGMEGGSLPILDFTGNPNQALVTTINASRLIFEIFRSYDIAGPIVGGVVVGGSAPATGVRVVDVTQTLQRASRRALANLNTGTSIKAGVNVPIDRTLPCDGGVGFSRTTGTIDDTTLTGTLTLTTTNCLLDGQTLNAQGTLQVITFDLGLGEAVSFIATFVRATIRAPGISIDVGGSLRVDHLVPGPNSETLKSNLIILDNLSGLITRDEDLTIVSQFDHLPNPTAVVGRTINGRIHDSVYGIVDITTPTLTPLQFGTIPQRFPNAGTIHLVGDAGVIKVEALSSTRVIIRPDFNNDGIADNTVFMNWTDLMGPVGANIGDDDGDGMHNSWETFYSTVNPGDNPDGDLFTNILEYQNGTNPNVAN